MEFSFDIKHPLDEEAVNKLCSFLKDYPKRFNELIKNLDNDKRILIISMIFFKEISKKYYKILRQKLKNTTIPEVMKDVDELPNKFFTFSELFEFLRTIPASDLFQILPELSSDANIQFQIYEIIKEGEIKNFINFTKERNIDISKFSKSLYHYSLYNDFNKVSQSEWDTFITPNLNSNQSINLIREISPSFSNVLYSERENINMGEVDIFKIQMEIIDKLNAYPYRVLKQSEEEINKCIPFPYNLNVLELKKHPIIQYIDYLQYLDEVVLSFSIKEGWEMLECLLPNTHKTAIKKESNEKICNLKIRQSKEENHKNDLETCDCLEFSIGKSPWIYSKCLNSEKMYQMVVENIYFYLSGTSNPIIKKPLQVLDSKSIKSDFFKILGVTQSTDSNNKSKPQIIWSKNSPKYQLVAFLDAFYSTSDDKWDKEGTINYGLEQYRHLISYDGEEIIPSENRRSPIYKNKFLWWREKIQDIINEIIVFPSN